MKHEIYEGSGRARPRYAFRLVVDRTGNVTLRIVNAVTGVEVDKGELLYIDTVSGCIEMIRHVNPEVAKTLGLKLDDNGAVVVNP